VSKDSEDSELDLLLSRGRLMGPAAERLRAQVLDAVAPAPRPLWRRPGVVAPALLSVATAAAILVLVPRGITDPGGGLRRKGTVESVVAVELTCAGGSPAGCPRGARLSAAFRGAPAAGFVGAFAEPAGGGERIWYFSAEDGPAALGPEVSEVRLGSRSVVLGPEHHGRYVVHLVLSTRPLTRAQLLDPAAPGVLARTTAPLVVPEGP